MHYRFLVWSTSYDEEKIMAMKVSDSSVISIPLRNLVSLIAGSCIAVYGYFGLTERLNFLEHELELKLSLIHI